MPPRKPDIVSDEAKQTLVFVNQVEAMIASGPHGKLDEYISVVDLLFNAVAMFEKSEYAEGLRHVSSLLSTAMDDLEFEFRDMLRRRSTQAMSKLNNEQLREARSFRYERSSTDPLYSDNSYIERHSDDGSQVTPGSEGTSELLPSATVRWLNQIAKRMQLGGASARCAEIYRVERVEFVNSCLTTLKTEMVSSLSLQEMTWETLENTCREWISQMNAVIGRILVGEYELCVLVMEGLGFDQTQSFSGIVSSSFELVLKGLFRVGRDIAGKRFPEQLFAMLDIFDTVEELQPHVRKVFGEVGREDLYAEYQALPRMTADAVMATFDQMGTMLKDIPASKDSQKQSQRPKLGFFRSPQQQNVEVSTDVIPKGGTVHPITSYVVNYVRGYLHRLGRRNCASILEKVFSEHGGRRGGAPRSVDRETGLLVTSLCQSLEARAKLYKDNALQHLFLLNNINYLYRSMLLWHSWHGLGLQRAITIGQREGNEELVRVLMEVQDDNIVGKYITKFQSAALAKIFSIVGEPSPEVTGTRGLSKLTESITEVKNKMKKFVQAFDELCQQQLEWIIPDDELKIRLRGQWVNIIKERHRRLLLPHWDDLANSKYNVRPEDIESRVVAFFQNPSGN